MMTWQYDVSMSDDERVCVMTGSAWSYDDLRAYGDVVWSEDAWTLVTWNGGATFNVWVRVNGGEAFGNVDCFTRYGVTDEGQARQACREWFADQLETVGMGE